MNRVTVAGLTPARSAKRVRLSNPATGKNARRPCASRRSEALSVPIRLRTNSPTRNSGIETILTVLTRSGWFDKSVDAGTEPLLLCARPHRTAWGDEPMTVQGIDSDTETLHKLGYAQELLRRMGGFSNFAVSFTIISILSGCLTAYGVAMFNGGP